MGFCVWVVGVGLLFEIWIVDASIFVVFVTTEFCVRLFLFLQQELWARPGVLGAGLFCCVFVCCDKL